MSDSMSMTDLKREQTVKRVRVLALAETIVILGLVSWLSVEYSKNLFMQQWVLQNFWPAGVLLNGSLAWLIVGGIAGWAIASYHGRRSREQAILDKLRKIV